MNQQRQRNKENVKVIVRVRPLLDSEEGSESCLRVTNHKLQICNDPLKVTEYNFDMAFDQNSQQSEVFSAVEGSLAQVFDGFNVSIFVYGQTGSGKTFTMFGADQKGEREYQQKTGFTLKSIESPSQQLQQKTLMDDGNYAGLIPRCLDTLYSLNQEKGDEYRFYCSFLQIYNENVFDLLLNKSQPLKIHENVIDGVYIEGLSEYSVSCYNDCVSLIKRAEKNRNIRHTTMNQKSSRSHTILQIIIEAAKADHNGQLTKAKINLCDLAGSEKMPKQIRLEGLHLKELKSINLSLTTLGKVINILSKGSKLPIPYRESKLTRLLQNSLGGNTRTFLICTLNPTSKYLDESYHSLQFAERARNIQAKVNPNKLHAQDEIVVQQLQKEIQYLRDVLNIKRKGIKPQDLQQKLIILQNENNILRKNNLKVDEIESLLMENKKMKEELQKIKVIGQSELNSEANEFYPTTQNDLNSNFSKYTDNNKLNIDIKVIRPNDFLLRNGSQASGNQLIKKSFLKNDNISERKMQMSRSILAPNEDLQQNQFGDNHVKQQVKTQVEVRIKKKYDYQFQKGNIEEKKPVRQVVNSKQTKLAQRQKALERLRDLEKIQDYNQQKFQQELDFMDKSQKQGPSQKRLGINNSSVQSNMNNNQSINNMNAYKEQNRKMLNIERQKRKLNDINNKMSLIEKNLLQM